MRILIPVPSRDFDPSEVSLSWKILSEAGHAITFSTPNGARPSADPRMLNGTGLGPWKKLLMADDRALAAHAKMTASQEFQKPRPWASVSPDEFQALLLPGGHAPGMKEYLESETLQKIVSAMFETKPVAAICHGVVLAARSKRNDGKSVLYERKTTSLLKSQELAAWALTAIWLGSYYRTYPETVQDEVIRNLKSPDQFVAGPAPLFRDTESQLERGFVVTDGNYVSARWPGDGHRFAIAFGKMLGPG